MKLIYRLQQLSLSQRNAVIALWLVIICNGAFFHRLSELTPYDGWPAGLFFLATGFLLIAYFSSFLQLITWGPLARP
ncbi:MAG: hypothetical protein ABIR53_06260, partial [Paraperlucidibaca sp.]